MVTGELRDLLQRGGIGPVLRRVLLGGEVGALSGWRRAERSNFGVEVGVVRARPETNVTVITSDGSLGPTTCEPGTRVRSLPGRATYR